MKNALKKTAYLKHLNGRRFHYTSLVDRACGLLIDSAGRLDASLDKSAKAFIDFGIAAGII